MRAPSMAATNPGCLAGRCRPSGKWRAGPACCGWSRKPRGSWVDGGRSVEVERLENAQEALSELVAGPAGAMPAARAPTPDAVCRDHRGPPR